MDTLIAKFLFEEGIWFTQTNRNTQEENRKTYLDSLISKILASKITIIHNYSIKENQLTKKGLLGRKTVYIIKGNINKPKGESIRVLLNNSTILAHEPV